MSLFRKSVEAMVGYVPGEQPKAGTKIIKLNTNENPYPPSPTVLPAIQAELEHGAARLRLYSDPHATSLREAASEVTGLPVDQILHGNGSDELLALLFRAFLEPGDSIAYPYPTYVLYRTLAAAAGAEVQTFDFDADFNLPETLGGCDAKLVFVATPNSPSGTQHPTEKLRTLARSLKHGVLVVDEAYAAFSATNALELATSEPNVVVLRTFSKSHSLAGMRLGLAFASKDIISGLNKVKDSYNLDRLAIVAGAASLRDTAWTAQNVAKVVKTRERLTTGLTELGYQVLPSSANFVFARAPISDGAKSRVELARGAFEHLKANGILVRYFAERLLDDGLRITVGTDDEIDSLLTCLKDYAG
ncbi:MAG: histidinol-phosphate transaminase [Myxococcales bacterium]|nr:histidinol-phosphate transaminase [Myxococcales bacterium]